MEAGRRPGDPTGEGGVIQGKRKRGALGPLQTPLEGCLLPGPAPAPVKDADSAGPPSLRRPHSHGGPRTQGGGSQEPVESSSRFSLPGSGRTLRPPKRCLEKRSLGGAAGLHCPETLALLPKAPPCPPILPAPHEGIFQTEPFPGKLKGLDICMSGQSWPQ